MFLKKTFASKGDGAIPLNVMNKYLKEKLNQRFPPRIDAVERQESDTHPEIAARNKVTPLRSVTSYGDHLKARLFESQAVDTIRSQRQLSQRS
jgi:hypothetical protein